MKYLPLVWSGIWRKPGRTVLIFLQVAVYAGVPRGNTAFSEAAKVIAEITPHA